MNTSDKNMLIALTLSALLVFFNIVAVLSGSATTYYSKIDQFIFNILPMLSAS
jgi:hypothetical protein